MLSADIVEKTIVLLEEYLDNTPNLTKEQKGEAQYILNFWRMYSNFLPKV